MNPSEIKQIIDAVCSTDIKKFKYANNGIKIEIDRSTYSAPEESVLKVQPQQFAAVAQSSMPVAVPAAPAASEQPTVSSSEERLESDRADQVLSPIVGVFYASPTPESAAYVKVGETVKKGTILCIVEAMKVMNEITAECDMKVLEMLVSNEQLVEFGQPLFKVEKL